MSDLAYPVVVVPLPSEEGGGYLAVVPDLHGCMSDGDTPEEAVANVRLAIEEWSDEMRRLGREIPLPGSSEREEAAERDSWLDLIQKQDEALKEQEQILGGLSSNVQSLREQVLSRSKARGSAPGDWTRGLPAPAAGDQDRR